MWSQKIVPTDEYLQKLMQKLIQVNYDFYWFSIPNTVITFGLMPFSLNPQQLQFQGLILILYLFCFQPLF